MLTFLQKTEKRLQKCLPILQEEYHVRRIGLFGNIVRSSTVKPKEIEILMDADIRDAGWASLELRSFLEEQLGYHVVVVYLHDLKPNWKNPILQEVRFLNEKKPSSPILPEKLRQLYLEDLRQTITTIAEYLNDVTVTDFIGNKMLVDAVIYNLITLSKIVQRLPEHLRQAKPNLPWQQMLDDNERLVKSYKGLDTVQIWNFCTKDLPMVKQELTILSYA